MFALTLVPSQAAASKDGKVRLAKGIYLAEASDVADPGARRGRESRSQRQPRVVGGQATTIERWPWQAAVTMSPALFGGNAYQRQICGGSVVAPTLVITAAHCLVNQQSGVFLPRDTFAAVTGRTVLSSSQGQESLLANYFIPTDSNGVPLYDHRRSRWDVAMLQLSTPSNATPIRLAGADERGLWEGGQTSFVSGWGELGRGGGYPDRLHSAQIAMVSDAGCASGSMWGSAFHQQTMVCAGELAGGIDTCSGDSGGPLVVGAGDGTMRLVGDTSFGSADCGEPGLPGVYGRIADDPMRTVLRNAALSIAGAEIVGAGGGGGTNGGGGGGSSTGTGQPEPLSAEQARALTLDYSRRACDRRKRCRRSSVRPSCASTEGGFRCVAINVVKKRSGRRSRCRRKVLWSGDAAEPVRSFDGRFRCPRGRR